MRKALVYVVLLLAVAGGVFLFLRQRGADSAAAKEPPTSVADLPPVKAPSEVIADGHLAPVRYALLPFAVSGEVVEVLVEEGQQVKAGQVLARLQADQHELALAKAKLQRERAQAQLRELTAGPLQAEVEGARAAVDVAQAQLAQLRRGARPDELEAAVAAVNQAQASHTAAMRTGRQAEIQAAQSALAAAESKLVALTRPPREEELTLAEAEVRRAQAKLDQLLAGPRQEALVAAEADVKAALHGVAQAELELGKTVLRAPFDGTIVLLDVRVGGLASPGSPAVRLADLTAWEILTDDLGELKVTQVREGAPVSFTLDALPETEFAGRVTRIQRWGEKRQGEMTYVVTIRPDQVDERFRWNMTASVTIHGE